MKRSKFSLSHTKLFSSDMGQMIPCGMTEVLPGDTVQQSTNMLLRVSPLLAPVMHPVNVRLHHWYVPHRLVFPEFENFITGGPDGFDATVFPTIDMPGSGGAAVGSLADYLGVPTDVDDLTVSALPFRAMALIYNEWYRDQDLVDPLELSTDPGPDTTTSTELQNCAWEKDYFTSARPWTQKGPEITLPLTGTAPITGLGKSSQTYPQTDEDVFETGGTGQITYDQAAAMQIGADTQFNVHEDPDNPGFPNIRADLSQVQAASINDLRLAFALQRYEEARARYGSRYTEYLRHLGVKPSDARLQRPEYLGGGTNTIQFSEVLATAQDNEGAGGDINVGDLKGHGIAALRSNKYRRFFEEHGYVITIMSVRPKTIYTQGLPRTWNRRTKEDFWQKELEHIGQQEILNKEIYADAAEQDGIFGYQDRYDEYRSHESMVSGEFRTTELDYWHMARQFATEPALNSDFVTSNPTKRINAVQTNDVLWCMARHSIQARRYLSKKGNSYIF